RKYIKYNRSIRNIPKSPGGALLLYFSNIEGRRNNMKRLGLFYFSGTGNTRLVAGHIGEEFREMGWEVTEVNMESVTMKSELPNLEEFDLIGIGAQVIGYTLPRRASKFVKLLPRSQKGTPVFIFRTCGGVAETNYTASHSLMKMLGKKNYSVFYERLFSIGSNWIFKFDDDIMRRLYEATQRKIKLMCREVTEGRRRFYETSLGLRLKKKLISGQSQLFFQLMGKNMQVTQNCSKCGLCAKNCPEKNIKIVNGRVKFKSNCSACLRCVYQCPNKAIRFRFLKFIPLKNGYDVKQSLSPDKNIKEETNGRIPPFFERYISDDTM
ncbi:MAG TPA: EFR1 family ferrodoxin, partial [Clostridia bacterium]|nr:EFR1 family ferrodoxin [Clostridia bacterium]